MTGNPVRRLGAFVMAGSMLVAGCGTRVKEQASPTAGAATIATPAATDDAAGPAGGAPVPAGSGAGSATAPSGAATTKAAPLSGGAVPPSRTTAAGAIPGPSTVSGNTVAAAAATPARPGGATVPAPGGSVGGNGGGGALPPAGNSPVVLASLGTQSGPIGATLKPIVRGLQIWAADVNAEGGLNGHPVRVLVYDDGGDPARAKANTQDAIERKGAIALVANTDAISGSSTVDYVTEKRVPIIGGDHARTFDLKSAMFFPVTAVGVSMYRTALVAPARYLVPQGKKKLGWFVCVETPICPAADKVWQKEAPAAGWEPVYRGQVSVAQPDYTSECLAARSAGAEVLIVIMDSASFERFARSCARQNYHPTLVGGPGVTQADRMKSNPDVDGMVAIGLTFPYFQTGTPATDEFQRAMRQFAPGEVIEQGTSQGWASAKLLEKAAGQIGEPPTSAAILKGLWAVNGDTLGGLTEPLAFHENQPPDPKGCWFTYITKQGSWVSTDNFALHCL